MVETTVLANDIWKMGIESPGFHCLVLVIVFSVPYRFTPNSLLPSQIYAGYTWSAMSNNIGSGGGGECNKEEGEMKGRVSQGRGKERKERKIMKLREGREGGSRGKTTAFCTHNKLHPHHGPASVHSIQHSKTHETRQWKERWGLGEKKERKKKREQVEVHTKYTTPCQIIKLQILQRAILPGRPVVLPCSTWRQNWEGEVHNNWLIIA